jgi:hypothetical protein
MLAADIIEALQWLGAEREAAIHVAKGKAEVIRTALLMGRLPADVSSKKETKVLMGHDRGGLDAPVTS